MLGLNFIGLSYLLVYVGAVSILFLFILMLINVRVSELFSNTSNSVPLAIIISILFSYPIRQTLPYNIVYDYISEFTSTFNNVFFSYFYLSLNKLFKVSGIVLDNREVSYVTSNL